MSIQLTKQEALAFIMTHADDWLIGSRQAEAIAKALGIELHFAEPWQDVMYLYYLMNMLEMQYADVLDEEAKRALAREFPTCVVNE